MLENTFFVCLLQAFANSASFIILCFHRKKVQTCQKRVKLKKFETLSFLTSTDFYCTSCIDDDTDFFFSLEVKAKKGKEMHIWYWNIILTIAKLWSIHFLFFIQFVSMTHFLADMSHANVLCRICRKGLQIGSLTFWLTIIYYS